LSSIKNNKKFQEDNETIPTNSPRSSGTDHGYLQNFYNLLNSGNDGMAAIPADVDGTLLPSASGTKYCLFRDVLKSSWIFRIYCPNGAAGHNPKPISRQPWECSPYRKFQQLSVPSTSQPSSRFVFNKTINDSDLIEN